MLEVPHAGKNHCDTVLVCSVDNLGVTDRVGNFSSEVP